VGHRFILLRAPDYQHNAHGGFERNLGAVWSNCGSGNHVGHEINWGSFASGNGGNRRGNNADIYGIPLSNECVQELCSPADRIGCG